MQFELVSKFEKHQLAIHNEGKPHICKFCGDRFRKTILMQTHIARRHLDTNVRSKICSTCGDGFKTSNFYLPAIIYNEKN